MFQKDVRKKLLEHNWLSIQDSEKNPSQTYRRFRKRALTAIKDLSLLARKLPTNKQQEIFNEDTIQPFLLSLFLVDESEKDAKLRLPNVELASLLVQEGVKICLSRYREWNKDTPESAKPTIEYLERAIQICNEIGYKYYRSYIEQETSLEKRKLICVWENRFTKDIDRFENYIIEEMKLQYMDISFEEIKTNKINGYKYNLWFNLGDPIKDEREFLGSINIVFSLDVKQGGLWDDNKGTITFYSDQNKEIKSEKIRILKYGSKHALMKD